MAFSFRKIISNIGYFKKPEDDENEPVDSHIDPDFENKRRNLQLDAGDAESINFEPTEPDSTSIQNSLNISESMKKFTAKKGSLSDTDLVKANSEKSRKDKHSKKLKVDINKANQSMNELNSENIENTPKHVLLECKSSEIFSERMKLFDFSKSLEFDSDHSSFEEENIDIESLSDDEISLESTEDKSSIKMCRKVFSESSITNDAQLIRSVTPESFGEVEVNRNELDRATLLLKYQIKFEKIEAFLKTLLTEFKFHIEVSKIFNTRTPSPDASNLPQLLGAVTSVNHFNRGVSPTGSWNMLMENEDRITKQKLKKQLISIQMIIDEFVTTYLKNHEHCQQKMRPYLSSKTRSITFDLHKGKRLHKHLRVNSKKKIKHFDFPDIRDAMLNLFSDSDSEIQNSSIMSSDHTDHKCTCSCHQSPSESDSGVTTKEDRSMSITSSIGNFSLDSTTLSAYSDSLDQVISYNSFQDTTLYSMLLQKPAIERITFYIQAHSIQMKCEISDQDFESKNTIIFHCPACKTTETDENGLLKHILSQYHCEKIHFLYKTVYIKKCVQAGKEIQPSTVLNPMKMYRDENKIVCFGDAVYACSLCFENPIVGESILMAHCSETEHVERRNMLADIFE